MSRDMDEMLSQIKHKLSKYSTSSKNDSEKVKYYLSQLKKLEKVSLKTIEESGLIECVKKLKKKQDPSYSQEAEEVLTRWKAIRNATAASEANTNGTSKEANRRESTTKHRVVEKPTIEVKHERVVPEQEAKKAKLSIADYKGMKKENVENEKRVSGSERSSQESNGSNSSSIADSVTKKIDKTVKSESTSTRKMSSSNNNTNGMMLPTIPNVPLPTLPVADILSSLMPSTGSSSSSSISNGSSYNSSGSSSGGAYRNSSRSYTSGVSTAAAAAVVDDEDTLTSMLRSKRDKMQMYSGRRNHDGVHTVPKLFDMATRVLIDNLDDLPLRIAIYNQTNKFALAFSLIKGVLERANARQLKTIEYYSPHLLDDTDYLWKRLSEQEFKRVEDRDEEEETWREYYFKKCDEREAKFQKARDAVSRLQANKPKERQTQMATVKVTKSSSSHIRPTMMATTVSSGGGGGSRFPVKTSTSSFSKPLVKPDVVVHSANGRKPTLGSMRSKANTAPPMSQGMKATMKLMKSMRR